MAESVQPLVQPVLDDVRNALTMADWNDAQGTPDDVRLVLRDIARLLRHAIEGLSEPNLAAMQAGEILLAEWQGTPEPERQLRDTLAGILHAQLTGEVPKTWERE